MKRFGTLLLALALVMTAGLAQAGEASRAKLGVLDIAGVAALFDNLFSGEYEIITLPTMNELLIALRSGRVDAVNCVESYAEFLLRTDDSFAFERIDKVSAAPLTMLTRADDAELTQAVNDAIATLKENGTLEALHLEYIEGATPDSIPKTPPAQVLDGAREVIVGVSGDSPPHDYINVAGEAAGFNVALMQEIAALAGLNVRFEVVMFGSKFAALESGRVDLFFLHAGYISFEGIVQTEAYDEGVYFGLLTLK